MGERSEHHRRKKKQEKEGDQSANHGTNHGANHYHPAFLTSLRSFVYQGGSPVSISYTNIPSDHQSTAVPCPLGSRETISGARYSGVPQKECVLMRLTSGLLFRSVFLFSLFSLLLLLLLLVAVVGLILLGCDTPRCSSTLAAPSADDVASLSRSISSRSKILDRPKSASLTWPSPSNSTC